MGQGTILECLKEYGQQSFEKKAFGAVDCLILCLLSYLKFDDVLPHSENELRFLSMEDISKHEKFDRLFSDVRYERKNRALVAGILGSRRFEKMELAGYCNLVDPEKEMQFCALTFRLEKKFFFVAFRGTDENLVGWKEDFNMAYCYPTEGQKAGVNYLNRIGTLIGEGSIMVGGHSKGGNLAVYSAMKCTSEIRNRICRIYSMDGPGFRMERFMPGELEQISNRIVKILPRDSMVGMLFQQECDYLVVESKNRGLSQHDPFSWLIGNGEFVWCKELRKIPMCLDNSVNRWIFSLDENQSCFFVDTLYRIISSTGCDNLITFTSNKKKCMLAMVHTCRNMDRQTLGTMKRMVVDLLETVGLYALQEEIKMKIRLKEKDWEKIAGILSFLVPIVVMMGLFVVKKIYPFGTRSFMTADLYHQYMPFFTEFMDKIRTGESLSYAWNVGVGSNFYALYGYYLASPFHWLGLLVPAKHIIEFLSYLVIFKIGLCGYTSFRYLRSKRETTEESPLIPFLFSMFYALSGFMAAYNYNIMWLDCVILLPLIVMGLEKLVKEGNGYLYCITLALSIFTNFYLSIMICMFLVMYFAVLLLTERFSVKTIGKFAVFSLLAGGMAGMILIPEVCALMATDFGDASFPDKWKTYFSILDVLARHCAGVGTERGLAHWPNIYSGAVTFLLVPLYALNDRIPLKKRFCNLFIIGFFLVSFCTNYLEFIWHGFNFPDSLPARQSFIYIFLVISVCLSGLQKMEKTEQSKLFRAYIVAVGFLLFAEKFVEQDDFKDWTVMLNIGFVTVYGILIYFYTSKRTWKYSNILLACIAILTVLVETTFNMEATSLTTCERENCVKNWADYHSLYEQAKSREDSFFRVEKFTRKTKNDSVLGDFPTATVFSSTMNSQVMDFYHSMGMRYSKVYYCFEGATPLASALLNVNYMLEADDSYENELYRKMDTLGEITLYECTATLPFGYVAPTGFELPEENENPAELQNGLMHLLGSTDLLIPVDSEQDGNDVLFEAPEDGIYYGMVNNSGTKAITITGGTPGTIKATNLKKEELFYMGHLNAGDSVEMTNGDDSDDSKKIVVTVYRVDQEALNQALEVLGREHLEKVTYGDRNLSGNLHLSKAGRLILSVPAEKGWTLKLNGEKKEFETFGKAFVALDLEAGDYTVDMKYTPDGIGKGWFLSVVCILLFGGVYYLENPKKFGKTRKKKK